MYEYMYIRHVYVCVGRDVGREGTGRGEGVRGGGVNVSYRHVDMKRERVKREGVEGGEGGGEQMHQIGRGK